MSATKFELLDWIAAATSSSRIGTGLSWTVPEGWRGYIMLETGKTLMLTPRGLRRLADVFERAWRQGGGKVDITWLIGEMRAMASEAERKTAAGEIPDAASHRVIERSRRS